MNDDIEKSEGHITLRGNASKIKRSPAEPQSLYLSSASTNPEKIEPWPSIRDTMPRY